MNLDPILNGQKCNSRLPKKEQEQIIEQGSSSEKLSDSEPSEDQEDKVFKNLNAAFKNLNKDSLVFKNLNNPSVSAK